MPRKKTSNEIIAGVKMRAMLPDNSATFLPTDFLDILNEEFNIGILPAVMKVHEEYYVYPHLERIVGGQRNYTIPHRAIGTKIRDLELVDSSGNVVSRMTRIQPEDAEDYIYNGNAFYFQNDQVILLTEPTASTYLKMSIFLRPNELVVDSDGAVISAIDTTTGEVTVSSLPSKFGSLLGAGETEKFDFIAKNSPYKIRDFDIDSVSVNTTTKVVTFDPADLPSDLIVGDYLMWAEETIVPQLPLELVPLLEQRAAVYCLQALGDAQGQQLAEVRMKQMEENINTLIDSRSDGNPQKIINRNSTLRRRYRRYDYKG